MTLSAEHAEPAELSSRIRFSAISAISAFNVVTGVRPRDYRLVLARARTTAELDDIES